MTGQVPVTFAIFLTLSWIFLCAGLFLIWEREWDYFQAFYFFFVSLSTIGLGDVVPSKPNYMVMNFGLVIIGLSLVSMTLNVIQMNIQTFLYRMLKMIQEEYEAAIEAGLSVNKQHLANSIIGRQPWYIKKMAPIMMTHGQKKCFEDLKCGTANAIRTHVGVQYEPQPQSQTPFDVMTQSANSIKSYNTVDSQINLSNFVNRRQTSEHESSTYELDQYVPDFMKKDVACQTIEPYPVVVTTTPSLCQAPPTLPSLPIVTVSAIW